jgi:hypothetical protein
MQFDNVLHWFFAFGNIAPPITFFFVHHLFLFGALWIEKNTSDTPLPSTACSFGLSATSQQYFSLRTNQPSAISQQYFSLRTNQHQPSATSQTNRLQASFFISLFCIGSL